MSTLIKWKPFLPTVIAACVVAGSAAKAGILSSESFEDADLMKGTLKRPGAVKRPPLSFYCAFVLLLRLRGWLARRLVSSLFAIGAGLFYFGELLLLPFSTGVSWASHFWGFAGGVVMAWWVYGRGVIPLVAAGKPASTGPREKRWQK